MNEAGPLEMATPAVTDLAWALVRDWPATPDGDCLALLTELVALDWSADSRAGLDERR